MNCSVSAISATTPTTASQASAAAKQRKQDYANLMSSLQSSDIESAKTAYAKLTANQAPPANSPLAALGAALQTGDTAAVQKATAALQQARGGHHHHHHDADASKAPTPPTPPATANSTVNILA
ncbi:MULTISPECIES: hypothetical protein [Sphingomonas]|jgi:predicted negative regulator of RcsB-dependent stress response|uniref:Uncharacterized protein n=1 Tax=Sphingomonas echinoides TaxID=59803 RepID=A0ABU4PL60_9SPHN|nr:hypothetical protein [Sphingomonas echinoides]MDX5982665.1 hypothetical protein [Sphingomonas echinoides]